MGGVALGFSFFATYSSTNSFVGFAGRGYSYGAPWLLLTPFLVFFSLLAWTLIAPRLRTFAASLNSLTIPDFFGSRYASNGARLGAALIVLAVDPVMRRRRLSATDTASIHHGLWLAVLGAIAGLTLLQAAMAPRPRRQSWMQFPFRE